MKILLVFLTTLITITSALLLDYGAGKYPMLHIFSIIIITAVLFINVLKFKLWGMIHARYNLSESYPATALFFPLIYAVSILKGDTQLSIYKIAGILLIIFGVFYMNSSKREG